jgi:superfamily II DNA/RNA helicase
MLSSQKERKKLSCVAIRAGMTQNHVDWRLSELKTTSLSDTVLVVGSFR